MHIAVLGADFIKRKEYAESLARKHGVPLITGFFDDLSDLNTISKDLTLSKLKEALDGQIKKQIFYRNGYVTNGCSLDYIVFYKMYIDISQEKVSIPEIIRARLHAWRQINKIIYLPLGKNNKMLAKYDSYLIRELNLLRENKIPIEIMSVEPRQKKFKGDDKVVAEGLYSRGKESAFV